MVKINSRKGDSPYLYKLALEFLGRSFEVGISREELTQLKEKGARYFPKNGKLRERFVSLRSKFNAKRKVPKGRVSKEDAIEEKADTKAERRRATASA